MKGSTLLVAAELVLAVIGAVAVVMVLALAL